MKNEELKKKIVEIIINAIWKDAEADYDSTDETEAGSIADALIAAGIGDVKKLQFDNEVLKMKNFFLEGAERSTEEDRQVWISKWEEAEHRAEVAERALENEIKNRINITGDVEGLVYTYYGRAIYQAEKELAEERKDD